MKCSNERLAEDGRLQREKEGKKSISMGIKKKEKKNLLNLKNKKRGKAALSIRVLG